MTAGASTFILTAAIALGTCDTSLWQHVYRPARLVVLDQCIRVTGTVVLERYEPDGDVHIRLEVDRKFRALLDTENRSRQRGALVLEPICVGRVSQASAMAACRGFKNMVAIPRLGAHVAVTGSYVHDIEPGHGWMEIHPVTRIELTK